jgi:hypothetical protein
LNSNKRDSQRQLNLNFLPIPLGRFGQSAQELKGLSQISDRFDVGRMRLRAMTSLKPATNGQLVIACFLLVIG